MTPEESIDIAVDVAERVGGSLIGDADALRVALLSAIVGNCVPQAVLEVRLDGGPTDVMAVYRNQRPIPDESCGWYREAFEWFSTTKGFSTLGVSFDVPNGTAGAYLEFGDEVENVAPFAESIGLDRTLVDSIVRDTPDGWPVHYVGHFPDREGSPIRIGGYLTASRAAELASDQADVLRLANLQGAEDLCRRVSAISSEFQTISDWQLDVLEDGSIGPRMSMGVGLTNPYAEDVIHMLGVGQGLSRSVASVRHTERMDECVVEVVPSMVKVSNDGSAPKAYIGVTVTPRWPE